MECIVSGGASSPFNLRTRLALGSGIFFLGVEILLQPDEVQAPELQINGEGASAYAFSDSSDLLGLALYKYR